MFTDQNDLDPNLMMMLSHKTFDWSPEEHQQAAQEADQQAMGLHQQMQMFPVDHNANIQDLQNLASWHRGQAQQKQKAAGPPATERPRQEPTMTSAMQGLKPGGDQAWYGKQRQAQPLERAVPNHVSWKKRNR